MGVDITNPCLEDMVLNFGLWQLILSESLVFQRACSGCNDNVNAHLASLRVRYSYRGRGEIDFDFERGG